MYKMFQYRTAQIVIFGITCSSVIGCSMFDSVAEKGEIQYKSAGKAKPLDIPPDLNSLPKEERFAIPQAGGRSTATYSDFNKAKPGGPALVDGKEVLPLIEGASIQRQGSTRWLVVNQPADKVWNTVKEFWLENGFLLSVEQQEVGIMETDWAENRAKIPDDIIRRTLGKVFDGMFSTNERDKYRTRIEKNGTSSEIYISQRGLREVLNAAKDSSVWQARENDPELEIEFLRRLLLKFGTSEQQAKAQAVAARQPTAPIAQIQKTKESGNFLTVEEGFDRAWRRVGLALDRVGFTVEDRDRALGVYFVRYVDPDEDGEVGKKKGFFGNLFNSDNSKKVRQQYRVKVSEQGAGVTKVQVLSAQESPDTNKTAERILNLLREQLK